MMEQRRAAQRATMRRMMRSERGQPDEKRHSAKTIALLSVAARATRFRKSAGQSRRASATGQSSRAVMDRHAAHDGCQGLAKARRPT